MPPEVRAQPSILDRLLDFEPQKREEVPPSAAQAMRNYRAAVRRDLEWLLNTRCSPHELDERFEALDASVYRYGLPDYSAYGSVQARARLARAVKRVIELFEPRLLSIEVSVIDDAYSKDDRMLRFLITGLLRMDPAPEQVAFDTRLEIITGKYKVRED